MLDPKVRRLMSRQLTISLAVLITASTAAAGERTFEGPYQVAIEPAKRIRATLAETVTFTRAAATEWSLTAAYPPDFEGQSGAQATFRVDQIPFAEVSPARDTSPLQKPLVHVHWLVPEGNASSGFRAECVYEVTIQRRTLAVGAGDRPVRPLSTAERSVYLASNKYHDFRSNPFQTWLRKHDLKRWDSERDLDFAYRALETLSKTLSYRFDATQNRVASKVCAAGWSDCGGLSAVYVAILRANGIPARCLVGWNVKPAGPHARADFYAREVGWVPVDPAAAASAREINACFGKDFSDMVIMHVDLMASGRDLFFVQGFGMVMGQGEGTFQGMRKESELTVEDLPLPEDAKASAAEKAPDPSDREQSTSKPRTPPRRKRSRGGESRP
jgi:transglutaminase-like putative cysteine protease